MDEYIPKMYRACVPGYMDTQPKTGMIERAVHRFMEIKDVSR
jgi:hypothetical protein